MKKNILITGVMGHVGFSLAFKLAEEHNIIGIYNKTIDKKKFSLLKKRKVKLIKNNLSNIVKIKKIIVQNKIDNCVYCAAISHEIYAKKKPFEAIKSNASNVLNFLELLKRNKKITFIYVSTGSVFQDIKNERKKINENIVPTPKNIYAGTKRLGEIFVENYVNYYKIKACVLRISWVYGPQILNDKINVQRGPIPYILNYLFIKKNNSILFNSGGDFKASFTYIDDVIRVIFFLLNSKTYHNIYYHLGTGVNNSNFDISKIINKLFHTKKIKFGKNKEPWSNESVTRGPLIGNNLKNEFGYKMRYNIKSGIKEYIKKIIKNA